MSRSASGSTITIADAEGTELDSFQAAQVSQNIVISGMVTGETYAVSVDGQQAAEVVAGQGGSATGPGGMQGGVPGQRPGQVPGPGDGTDEGWGEGPQSPTQEEPGAGESAHSETA